MRVWCFVFSLLAAPAALASWQLNSDQSVVSFVTIKATDVAEVHHFRALSGQVSDTGGAEVSLDVASVDTLIPIRDERMRDILFEVARFPTIDIRADLDLEKVLAQPIGAVRQDTLAATLSLRDRTVQLSLPVLVVRLSEHRLQVSTSQAVIVNAPSVGLVERVEQLRELAGLPSISKAVPVTFNLVWERQVAASLDVDNARVRALIPGQRKTVGYFDVTNVGDEVVRLVEAKASGVGAIELHTTTRDGEMVRMRRLGEVAIEPGSTVRFRPGHNHLMLFRVDPLGESVPITLALASGAAITVPFRVVPLGDPSLSG